jgi:hypothetical protein
MSVRRCGPRSRPNEAMDDEATRLYCSNCGGDALFTSYGERKPCDVCGAMGITTEKPVPKPYRLTKDDYIFLRCQRIDPEV